MHIDKHTLHILYKDNLLLLLLFSPADVHITVLAVSMISYTTQLSLKYLNLNHWISIVLIVAAPGVKNLNLYIFFITKNWFSYSVVSMNYALLNLTSCGSDRLANMALFLIQYF